MRQNEIGWVRWSEIAWNSEKKWCKTKLVQLCNPSWYNGATVIYKSLSGFHIICVRLREWDILKVSETDWDWLTDRGWDWTSESKWHSLRVSVWGRLRLNKWGLQTEQMRVSVWDTLKLSAFIIQTETRWERHIETEWERQLETKWVRFVETEWYILRQSVWDWVCEMAWDWVSEMAWDWPLFSGWWRSRPPPLSGTGSGAVWSEAGVARCAAHALCAPWRHASPPGLPSCWLTEPAKKKLYTVCLSNSRQKCYQFYIWITSGILNSFVLSIEKKE